MADNDKSRTRGDELDAFWDIQSLLPNQGQVARGNRPRPTPADRRRVTPAAVDVELTAPVGHASQVPTDGVAQGKDEPEAVRAVPLTVRPDTALPRPTPTPRASMRAQPTAPTPPEPVPSGTGTLPDAGIGVPHYVPPHTKPEENPADDEYSPDGVLLHRVRVQEWRSNYCYFDQFAKDAARYAGLNPPAGDVRHVPFFSYFPQYAQLDRRQTNWYLYWRAQVRKRVYPDTDYAYILLYIFELINIPAEPEEAVAARDLLAEVWVNYRKKFPQLDHYMCEWLCDYCLIHHLSAPTDCLAPALDEIIAMSRLKEFYLSETISVGGARGDAHDLETARILLKYCCQYDYRKSKFAQGEHKELFDRIVPAAVAAVLPLLLGQGSEKPLITMQDTVMTRDAFAGALCSYCNKRLIEVSYTSFSRSHDLRYLVGDMVKHTENRLRGWIGVRSRLSVMSLPVSVRDALDAWLNAHAPAQMMTRDTRTGRKTEVRPEYEKLYDLPASPVSLSHADEIERASWETTRRLTEAFGAGDDETVSTETVSAETAPAAPAPPDACPEPEPECPVPAVPEPVASVTSLAPTAFATSLGEMAVFVRLALAGDYHGQRAYVKEKQRMPDALADEINAIAVESEIGDIILEDRGDGTFDVTEDYRGQVAGLLGEIIPPDTCP